MSTRRKLIEDVMSAVNDEDLPQVSISGCRDVSQINVFPGACINISYSNIDKSHVNVTSASPPDYFSDEMREGFYRKCHGIAKQYGFYPEMRRHMKVHWHAKSMRDLTDTDLQALLQYMRSLERQHETRAKPFKQTTR